MLQVPAEIARFVEIVAENKVRSYLEIGSKFGGSLWTVSQVLPKKARIVAVDLPEGNRADVTTRSVQACITELNRLGKDARVIFGDSTDSAVIEAVRKLGPFDAVFIDANHTTEFVESDWSAYGQMARMVAFHDIAWRRAPDWAKGDKRIDVGQLWDVLKETYRHEEIRLCPTGKNNGIGVLWRW